MIDKTVPNLHPKIKSTQYKLCVIGEAPGVDEIEQGIPFVGYSGKELDRFLSRFGIIRDACFIGNICQHQPLGNKIATFDWDGVEIQGGLAKLKEDLSIFRPNIALLLGGSALHSMKEDYRLPVKKKKVQNELVFNFPNQISNWRGSFFISPPQSIYPGLKCISSYHPAACLRQYEWTPLLMMDIKRAFDEAFTPELVLPQRNLKVNLTYEQTVNELDKILASGCEVGTDIEGFFGCIKCVSFAPSADYGFIVPFVDLDGTDTWTLEQEIVLMEKVVRILSSTTITKVWQNGLYDRDTFHRGMDLVVRGPNKDIMLRHWELYCELEKKLGVQGSLYTKEPWYKEERDSESQEAFWTYCCRDSAMTKEIADKLDKYLPPLSKQHAEFNETLLNALLYMQKRGINYDKKTAKRRLKEVQDSLYEAQAGLDRVTGCGLANNDKMVLRNIIRSTMCHKRDPSKVKKEYTEAYDVNMRTLLGEGSLTDKELGRLSIDLGLDMNVDGKKFKPYLYDTLKLPKQYSKTTGNLTSDYETLLALYSWCKNNNPKVKDSNKELALRVLPCALRVGELRTREEHLTSLTNCADDFGDNRIHTFYNEVGSETGRVTCGKLFKKYGYPMQTVEDENTLKPEGDVLRPGLRSLVLADEGCYLAKCDLKGADGWTVGANMAALGDQSMLLDLQAGVKPAQVLCYMFRHGHQGLINKPRNEVKEIVSEVKKDDWDYFACKQVVWGLCYLMGAAKAASHVFKLSEGRVDMSIRDAENLKRLLFLRYNVSVWWKAMERKLHNQPYPPKLTSPSGHTRMFFGRKQEILGEALAHEPQSVTTYATNRAVFRCWTDNDNRIYDANRLVGLRIEPLHQVHDEFLCQFKISDTEWAINKIKSWFDNEVVIAGIRVKIPFDGAFGTNWSMDGDAKKGNI